MFFESAIHSRSSCTSRGEDGPCGPIILRGRGTAHSKTNVLRKAGVKIANRPSEVVTLPRPAFSINQAVLGIVYVS
jgi:succinyl-CoA synthetase alpha subunit